MNGIMMPWRLPESFPRLGHIFSMILPAPSWRLQYYHRSQVTCKETHHSPKSIQTILLRVYREDEDNV